MTSFRQFASNRRNALRSTGPKTESGKQQSRLNAVRHGLTAETVIRSFEDAEDYKAFEGGVTAGYDPQNAAERELVLRLASLLWRLRRATAIETDLLEIQAEALREVQLGDHTAGRGRTRCSTVRPGPWPVSHSVVRGVADDESAHNRHEGTQDQHRSHDDADNSSNPARKLTYCFLRVANLGSGIFERLTRYEAALWRQTVQTLMVLQSIRLR